MSQRSLRSPVQQTLTKVFRKLCATLSSRSFLSILSPRREEKKKRERETTTPRVYTQTLSPDRETPRRCVSSCYVLARVVFLLTTESISANKAIIKFNDVNSGPAGNPYRYETIVLKCVDYLGREYKIELALIPRQSLSLEVN